MSSSDVWLHIYCTVMRTTSPRYSAKARHTHSAEVADLGTRAYEEWVAEEQVRGRPYRDPPPNVMYGEKP